VLSGLRGAMGKIFGPLAKLLIKIGVGPDAVTIAGTVAVVVTALWAFPTGHLVAGSLLIGLFAFTDSLDGTMARMLGRKGVWGAYLDSTLDRLADAAIFSGLALYFVHSSESDLATLGLYAALATMACAFFVSYARSRAEGLGLDGNVGFIERSERLLIGLLGACIAGAVAVDAVLVYALIAVAAGSFVTFIQRMLHVRKQALAQVQALEQSEAGN
jgi:CDP-diacylglycerol--glycerol-3-phosphate 3-phosphatidyltransferase